MDKTLFVFRPKKDGASPLGDLLADKAGNLYGTTQYGGKADKGVVFKHAVDGTETVLYSFTGGADGGLPIGPVSMDQDGNLYGSASGGGKPDGNLGYGVVFEIAPDGTETVLHAFAGGADGAYPQGGVTIGANGILYGTTSGGGHDDDGTVFALDKSGKLQILHVFVGGDDDGQSPESSVVLDAAGNLYGVTPLGGPGGPQGVAPPCCGVVYKISASGAFKVIYTFHQFCDGADPKSPPVLDSSGNLYGQTISAGCLENQDFAYGTIYKVTPSGTETLLHTFTEVPDGASPVGALLFDKKGNLYGTTANGGYLDQGTVFEIAADGTESILHQFQGGRDGIYPWTGLVADPAVDGALYGTTRGTFNGQAYIDGTIFKIRK